MYTTHGIMIVTLIAAGLVVINVLLHYEVLSLLSALLGRLAWVGRPRIALLICALLVVHILEIWIFAGGIMLAEWHGGLGVLKGDHSQGVLDYVYYSSMTYTTVGYGDLFPEGPLRFIAAMEALLGLMLISWSASFTYLEMQRVWPAASSPGGPDSEHTRESSALAWTECHCPDALLSRRLPAAFE